jgi:hypothetical protein
MEEIRLPADFNKLFEDYFTSSEHLFVPNVFELDNYPTSESTTTLSDYLGNSANRADYNDSFFHIKSDYYIDGEIKAYADITNNTPPVFPNEFGDINTRAFYNQPKFAQDTLNALSEKNVDFAAYALDSDNYGKSLDSVLVEGGTEVSVDPSFGGYGFFAAASAISGFSLFQALKIRKENKGKKLSKNNKIIYATGAASTLATIGSTGYYIAQCNNLNYYSRIIGYKGLCMNFGSFLLGNGLFNIYSGLKDMKKTDNKIKKISQIGFGVGETITGGTILSYSSSPMLSLIPSASGAFSISTQGLSSMLVSTLSCGIYLGIFGAALFGAGAIINYFVKKKKKH